MDCPACDKPLIVVERQGIELDWCAACQGLWFDADELELLAEERGRRLALAEITVTGEPAPSPPSRTCPRCRRRMEVRNLALVPPVAVDLCPQGHGVWLDRGELGLLLGGLPKSVSEPAQEVATFLGEVFPSGENSDRNASPTEGEKL